jgi:hypothetical protein
MALSTSACQPDRVVSVHNQTDLQNLASGVPRAERTLPPGGGQARNIETPQGKCSDHLQWRAIDPDGNVVSTLTKACQGDTWNVERKP